MVCFKLDQVESQVVPRPSSINKSNRCQNMVNVVGFKLISFATVQVGTSNKNNHGFKSSVGFSFVYFSH